MGGADTFGKLELELRRGVVVVATLSQLRTPHCGYELRQALADKGMPIEEGTLYPLLRHLGAQGLLNSERKIEDGPPRRYYSLNADGRKLLKLTECGGTCCSPSIPEGTFSEPLASGGEPR